MKTKTVKAIVMTLVISMMTAGCSETGNIAGSTEASGSTENISSTGTEKSTEAETETVAEPTTGENESTTSDAENTADFLYETTSAGTVKITKYNGNDSVLTIPSSIDSLPVTEIGESCFAGDIHVQIVHIPEGVEVIDDYAFECCEVLKKVYMPDSLKEIGNGAFSGCVSLYLADMQDNIETIGDGAFLECDGLINLVMPEKLNHMGQFTCAGCDNLVYVTFQDKLTELPDRVFYDCSNLHRVNLPKELKTVGKRAFANCESLPTLYFPETVTAIGDFCFENCSSMTNVNFPADYVSLGTFNGCYQMNWIEFSYSHDTTIEEGSLNGTPINTEALPSTVHFTEPKNPLPESGSDGEPEAEGSSEKEPETTGSVSGDKAVSFDESAFDIISNDDFADWAAEYVDFNQGNALTDMAYTHYISLYKGQVPPHYIPMAAALDASSDSYATAIEHFGDDFKPMYLMMIHGLETEMHNFRTQDSLVLYSGVYNSQLMAAAGTDYVPTLDELAARTGETFTDPIMISTTTDFNVACHFSDTLFIIYASKEALDAQGAVCMDSYMHTVENEILMTSNATYRILDVGVMDTPADEEHEAGTVHYVKVELQ